MKLWVEEHRVNLDWVVGYIEYKGQLLTPREWRVKMGLPEEPPVRRRAITIREGLRIDWLRTILLVICYYATALRVGKDKAQGQYSPATDDTETKASE